MSQHDTLTLREALRSIQYEAASLADAQVIALQALNATYPARAALSATQPDQAKQSDAASEVFTALADHCPVDNGWFNGRAAQGEPFGFVHHYVAHDSQGRIIDSTWEADGCEDEMPHPTHPIKWRWERSEPFYTKTSLAQGDSQRCIDAVPSTNPQRQDGVTVQKGKK